MVSNSQRKKQAREAVLLARLAEEREEREMRSLMAGASECSPVISSVAPVQFVVPDIFRPCSFVTASCCSALSPSSSLISRLLKHPNFRPEAEQPSSSSSLTGLSSLNSEGRSEAPSGSVTVSDAQEEEEVFLSDEDWPESPLSARLARKLDKYNLIIPRKTVETETDCGKSIVSSEENCSDNADNEEYEDLKIDKPTVSKCVVEPLTDAEYDLLERAHEESQLLQIYAEPSLRFIAIPPIPYFTTIKIDPYYSPVPQDGESGYQSETTPTFPQDNSTAVQEEGVNEIVSDEASTVTPSANTTRIPGKTGVGSTSTSSSRRHTSASQTLPTTTPSEPTSTPPTPGAAPSPPPSSLLDATGNFKVSEMDVLSEEIWCYHNSVTQTEATLNRKLHLRDMLYYAICPVFPMCGLYVVGSSLNGFGSNSSDMDLCLMITNKDLDQKTDAAVVLNMILSTLRQVEWVSHQQLIFAKVPILRLKFAAPFADITVDLNANNSVAIKNTHLLCYYSSFDWRVRPLVTIVKEWAKRKGMNDANRSSFTSYSLVLMVIHYLQCGLKPAVLPSLQAMYPKRFNSKCDVRSLNVTLPLTPPPDDWVYNDTATLGELLIGFLYYYAYTFDFNRDAMSIRMGKLVERAFVAKRNPNGHFNNNGNNWRSQWRCICIEEPFTHSNTAHSIYDEMVFSEIKAAFRDAYHELDATRDMQRLMNGEPIKAQPPNGGAMVFTTAYEPRSDHVLAVTVPRSAGPSGSTGSMHTARSGRSSCASSTSGGDNETERNRESPLSQLLGAPVSHAATSTTHAGNGIHHHGMRGSGSSHGKRRSGHHMRKGGTGQRV